MTAIFCPACLSVDVSAGAVICMDRNINGPGYSCNNKKCNHFGAVNDWIGRCDRVLDALKRFDLVKDRMPYMKPCPSCDSPRANIGMGHSDIVTIACTQCGSVSSPSERRVEPPKLTNVVNIEEATLPGDDERYRHELLTDILSRIDIGHGYLYIYETVDSSSMTFVEHPIIQESMIPEMEVDIFGDSDDQGEDPNR